MARSRPLIIINNTAAKARRVWPATKAKLEAHGIEFDFYETRQPGDATERSRSSLRDGCTTVVVVGGDGTLSEAAEGFFDSNHGPDHRGILNFDAALAVIPAGTGDDFARGIIGRRAPFEYWLETLIEHCMGSNVTTRRIDVLDASCENYSHHFVCLNASTMGIGGETAARVAAQKELMRRLPGEFRFMAAALGALAAWRERPVRISVDGRVVTEAKMNLVAVANGLYAGGGMMLSPQATITDGKLDVVTVSGLNRRGVMRELPRIHRGGHVKNPNVNIVQGKHVWIETFGERDGLLIEADGNVRGRTPAEFRVMPSALNFVGLSLKASQKSHKNCERWFQMRDDPRNQTKHHEKDRRDLTSDLCLCSDPRYPRKSAAKSEPAPDPGRYPD
jgi:diacylglycerol kinase (ATP)